MSWPIILVGLTGAFQIVQTQEAAKQQEYDLEREAEKEKLSAQTEELKRRERLNKILSANVESVASAGLAEGSQQSIALDSAKKASQSEAAESVSDRIRQDLLKRKAKQAKSMANIQSASTALSTGLDMARLRDG